MDETFTVLPCNLVQEFLSDLNSIEAWIQFTYEKETEDGKLPFLDVCLCRESDEFITSYSTSVYQKATHTNQYLPFYLHHPVVHKVAVVRTLMIQCTIIKWCGACGRREGNCGHTEGEWLPTELLP